jgi:thiol-disulfide isomerase/thioredoxin
MNRCLGFVAVSALTTSLCAQIPNGSICPNFTGTDLNGNTHELYSYLDQGYTVFIDVSTTWCGPCWTYHNSHRLADLYDQYGPGTNENDVMVLFVEADQLTTISDLNGQSATTQGNWVSGTPYPIINDHTIASMLQVSYYPTLFKVCPSRVITEISQYLTTPELWQEAQGCSIATYDNDAALLPPVNTIHSCSGDAVPLVARLQNMGTSPLTSATLEAHIGSDVIATANWNGSLATYENSDVYLGEFTPPAGTTTITYHITTTDDVSINNSTDETFNISNIVMPGVNVSLELRTDLNGLETKWKLYGPNGLIEEGGFPVTAPYSANTTYTYDWLLNDNDCYVFEINDLYSNGLCCEYGNGYYKLSVNGEVQIEGASFAAREINSFRTSIAASVPDPGSLSNASIYPNPTRGSITVALTTPEAGLVQFRLTDMVGRVVLQESKYYSSGDNSHTMDLEHISNGPYLINVHVNGSKIKSSKINLLR